MNLSNFKVSTRLGGSFALLLALVLTIVLAAGFLIKRVNDGGVFYFENIVPSLANIADARGDLEAIRHAEANHIMSNSYEEMDAIEQSIASKREHLTSTIAAYEKLVADDEDKRRWQKAQADAVTYLTFWEKLRLVSRQTTTDPTAFEKARNIFEIDERKAFETALNSLEKMWDHNETLGSGVIREAGTAYNTAKYTLGALGLLALTLGSLSAMLISRSITSQLGGEPMTATELARSIAGSDLSVHVPLQSGDNGSMMANFQIMVDSLSHVVREVRQNAEGVASVSTQIAQGNMDLSQRTEEYASSLEQTASSMEELRSVSRHNADNVKQANQLALGASSVAARGGAVVDEVVETMKGINEASTKIADIINVIDGIAFQTNILALNASVEAARAGEQGRGFAVVASEVRNLAQRSAEAAKEIKTLITTSVERVARGTVLVDQAGHTMADVVASIKRMTDLMNEIDIAINEQSTSVAQISDAVTQMDQMTQQNASLIEESAAAAGSLKQQAYDLVRAVAVFKLVRGNASSPALLSLPQPIAA